MSDRFRIHKTDSSFLPWEMDYPDGFSDGPKDVACSTFDFAVAEFVEASQRQCPNCRKGAVVDTDYGWKCERCGTYDVAVDSEVSR